MQMKKVKTSELSGAALDWAVAKCETQSYRDNAESWLRDYRIGFSTRYSSTWSQGGQIIDREGISIVYCYGDLSEPSSYWVAAKGQQSWEFAYGPYNKQDTGRSIQIYKDEVYYGSTPLTAAMRCYVASKLGDAVDVPEELF